MYDTEKEIKKVAGSKINKQLKEWKTKGYDTSFLK
jgi:hypothetical protein